MTSWCPEYDAAHARRTPDPVQWKGVKKVHVMGICGTAMGAFAGMLKGRGFDVRGSDQGAYPPMSDQLELLGIEIFEGYSPANLNWEPDVVVVGNVIRPDYPEAVEVRRRELPYCSLPQALAALFIAGRESIVVTGTHGKTTTSSMTTWLLDQAELNPSFMIGGITGNFDTNHRVSQGSVFVVEGDEYDTAYFDKGPKFLHYLPTIASINNVEFDHADIFADIGAVERTFERFVETIGADGTLIVPAGDATVERIITGCRGTIKTFGIDCEADIQATDLQASADGVRFKLTIKGHGTAMTGLSIWGHHNVENALTAAGLALSAGASLQQIASALPGFRLPKKRQELKGVVRDVPVIDDFAHHPTAIEETLKSTRMRYEGRRILALFEVESNTSRRRVFQDGFARALTHADQVWFCQPHEKADNLKPEEKLDLHRLIKDINDDGTPASLVGDIEQLAVTAAQAAQSGRDVILAMSGRNFHGIHDMILEALRR